MNIMNSVGSSKSPNSSQNISFNRSNQKYFLKYNFIAFKRHTNNVNNVGISFN